MFIDVKITEVREVIISVPAKDIDAAQTQIKNSILLLNNNDYITNRAVSIMPA